jgi:UDP:flavonoid glycosyltransferase YjiC (YdhE family)
MHLLVAVSAHGYGHIAQVAPVANELRRRLPGLRVTLYTAGPIEVLQRRFTGPFDHVACAVDVGMVMDGPLGVDVAASAAAYARFHANWEHHVAAEAVRLSALAPDLVLADVPYRVVEAAAQAGIPVVCLCSLNWADIYGAYCGGRPEATRIQCQILEAYRRAEVFLRPAPSMPMPDLADAQAIGPIARVGQDRRAEINARADLQGGERLVLVALGGVSGRLPMESWPRLPGVRWLVQGDWAVHRPDVIRLESLGLHFIDLVRSADVFLTKPGYGSFVEAACNATPLLYVSRGEWPEEPFLVEWLQASGRCREVARADLERGALAEALEGVLDGPQPPPVDPIGTAEAADVLMQRLMRR